MKNLQLAEGKPVAYGHRWSWTKDKPRQARLVVKVVYHRSLNLMRKPLSSTHTLSVIMVWIFKTKGYSCSSLWLPSFDSRNLPLAKSRMEICHLPTVVLCMDPNRCSVSGQQHRDQLGLVGQCQDYRCEWLAEAFNSCKGKFQKANKAKSCFR